ncbi:MAG: NAD(P)H-hydrate epimerase, partial [Acidobacteriota bacterium]
MTILTAEEMAAADRRSVEAGVSVRVLMENAGTAVSRFCLRRFAGDGLVVVVCGKGNNGGDGMVAARVLSEHGRRVRVALLGSAAEMKGDAAAACAGVRAVAAIEFVEIVDEVGLKAALEGADLVVDAVVGTGFKPPLRGLAAVARELLRESAAKVVAVDLPSGWDADSVKMEEEGAFRADAVVTFVAPKMAHVFGHLTAGTMGPVVVAGIGEPESAVVSETGFTWAGSSKGIAEKPRGVDGNKGKFGHVLVVGGAYGKAGAPAMASLACLRAGAGLVTAAVPREVLGMVAGIAQEL